MDLFGGNQTDIRIRPFTRCILYGNPKTILRVLCCGTDRKICSYYMSSHHDREDDFGESSTMSTTPESQMSSAKSGKHEMLLYDISMKILLPVVSVLIAICFILGVILIVKSYMMEPFKKNLAFAIGRRRRFGSAPDNNYVPAEEMRASIRLSTVSDRKSLPPPQVLMAARALRASQRRSESFHV